jgi:MFS transporter, ACDE family, multidrug resistance protein
MIRFLIYFFPAMMDMILGAIFFVTAVRYSESGASSLTVTGVMATWAFIYSIGAIVAGRIVNHKNAARLIIMSGGAIFLISLGYIAVPGLGAQYLWTALMGIATAFFFTPFQVLMKSLEQGEGGGVVRSTALYTFSWSFGMACGPFVCGYVWPHFGWKWCYALNAIMGLAIAFGIWRLNKYASRHHETAGASAGTHESVDYSAMPDLAWLGWLAAGVGCITVAVVRSLFPVKAAILELSKTDQGVILAVVSFTQAFTGLAFIRSRYWMYKPVPVALFSLSGLVGLLLFGIGSKPGTFYMAALFYGIYSGMFFFYLVFHSLVHPTKSSKYIAINEAVVGITAIFGPIAGGIIADKTNSNVPFCLIAILVLLVMAFQARVHCLKTVKN